MGQVRHGVTVGYWSSYLMPGDRSGSSQGPMTRQSGLKHPKELERRTSSSSPTKPAENGLPALDPDSTLVAKARENSDDMAKRQYFSHTSPDGKTFKDRYDDENRPGSG